MKQGYTLVVPTYNRSAMLAALLTYLEREKAAFPIMVLDSSAPAHRRRNRELVSRLTLPMAYAEFDEDVPPWDKFREGVQNVETPFCQICADDDLVLVDGARRCVEHLEINPSAAVAHGYYFAFLDNGDGAGSMDLTGILYFTPTIDSPEPLARLHQLFRMYQALTYGVYRTPILQHVLQAVQPLTSMLGRELLAGALSVVRGTVSRLPCFTNGRSMAASERYWHWHPLEWLLERPGGLFEEYREYKRILIQELIAASAAGRSREATEKIVDLIHLFYLVRHAPAESHDFILDHILAGKDPAEFWSAMEIQVPLIRASQIPMSSTSPPEASPAAGGRLARVGERLRRLASALVASPGKETPSAAMGVAGSWPRPVETPLRLYRLHRALVHPEPRELFSFGDDDIGLLIRAMDSYTPAALR